MYSIELHGDSSYFPNTSGLTPSFFQWAIDPHYIYKQTGKYSYGDYILENVATMTCSIHLAKIMRVYFPQHNCYQSFWRMVKILYTITSVMDQDEPSQVYFPLLIM
jgi:hypothetical protein